MNTRLENKFNFFLLEICLEKNDDLVTIVDQCDCFLEKVMLKKQPSIFIANNRKKIIYFFRTGIRKRKGSLLKIFESQVEAANSNQYRLLAYSYSKYEENLSQIIKSNKYKIFDLSTNNDKRNIYTREDIKILDDYNNFFPWEKDIYNMIFEYDKATFPRCKIKPAPFRKIHLILDNVGVTGKSTWAKWISNISKKGDVFELGHATSSQIKARVCKHYLQNGGAAKIYIIDLPRAKSRYDSDSDLILSLESIKNGMVSDAMYGSVNSIMFDPPWVLLFSNNVPEPTLMSIDRWQILKMNNKNKRLTKIPIKNFIKSRAIKKY